MCVVGYQIIVFWKGWPVCFVVVYGEPFSVLSFFIEDSKNGLHANVTTFFLLCTCKLTSQKLCDIASPVGSHELSCHV